MWITKILKFSLSLVGNYAKKDWNKGLSQERLAEKANLHRNYIGMLERGERNVTLITLEKIMSALGEKTDQWIKI